MNTNKLTLDLAVIGGGAAGMAAAIAATAASGPVTITDAQAVAKSYPAFFEDFTALGGIAHVESSR